MADRRSIRLIAAAASLALVGASSPMSTEALGAEPSQLDRFVGQIRALESGFGGEGVRALTIVRLDTGDRASLNGDTLLKSASAVKPLWVAAALERRSAEALAATARSALWESSNYAAGRAMDIAGGIDAVNRFARDAGLTDTQVYAWSFDHLRVSSAFPGPLRGFNTTTTDDLARFWELLGLGSLLEGEAGDALLGWTRGFKEEFDGNGLVRRLPIYMGAAASFKMGWLRGGISGLAEIGAGILFVPGGPAYVLAVGANDGADWGVMAAWLEYVACAAYVVLAEDRVDCVRAGDPVAIRERQAVPGGELETALARTGFVTVSGWAADPDAWWQPTLVAITFDGVVVARTRATPTSGQDLFAPGFSREFPFEGGEHEVCAIALNDGNGEDTAIGCRTVSL